ncbi:CynX/NimT family MFS transporter [Desulfitobacterium chlororespirans]|uniref:Lysosomal dipeptide transporter MFSD1 n=1 Tax=Desulfitobacterium chlororespirans DSM 11544 TaxID=1121395 RepID=A0A1M7UBM9_9FIRM|nr:MFS transporter [Desulfitobacterium chlororespirans]SHN80336.1 Predicted arabinose efflux permease, MFS family [Desulfitobacterium chlororespirans DSM 11544]
MANRQVQTSSRWVVLALSFFMMIGFALSLQALPPLFEQIMKEVSFSNSQAGILMGAYAIPGIFLPFIVAYLASRFDMKKLIIAALAIMMAGLIAFSTAGSFPLLVVYRLVAGIGATVLVVLAPLLITMFFDQKNIGIAMGIFNIAVPLGTVIAANLFGSLGQLLSWRMVLFGVAAFLGVVLLLVIFALSLPQKDGGAAAKGLSKEPAPKFRGSRSLWLLAGIWVLANFQLLAYVTFGPQFYQSFGLANQKAGFLTSLIMLASIFLAPVIGVAFDKTGRKKPYLLIGSAMILLAFVLLAFRFPGLPLWAVALGIGFAPLPVFVFAHLPETVKPHEVGMGMGMLTIASNLGTTMGPSALGSILDRTGGNFTVSLMVLAAVSIVIIAFSLGLKPGSSRSES